MAQNGADHLGGMGEAWVYLCDLERDIGVCSTMMELITGGQAKHGNV
jgi:hypothetical protein